MQYVSIHGSDVFMIHYTIPFIHQPSCVQDVLIAITCKIPMTDLTSSNSNILCLHICSIPKMFM